jgi:hypothetical protein
LPRSFSQTEAQHVPGARADVLRTAKMLPGVASGSASRLYFRGSPPEDVLVVFDQVPIADPFHLKSFQRLVSVFDTAAVERVDIYNGSFPVRFGTRSAGVIDLTPRTLSAGHEIGIDAGTQTVGASTIGTTAGGNVDWLFAVRRNQLDLANGPTASGSRQTGLLDLVGRARWHASDSSTWTVGTVLLNDEIQLNSLSGSELASGDARDTHLWLAHDWQAASGWRARTSVSLADARQFYGGSVARSLQVNGDLREERRLQSLELRSEWTLDADGRARWSFGTELFTQQAGNDYLRSFQFAPALAAVFEVPQSSEFARHSSPRDRGGAAFVSLRPVLGERLNAELGLRLDAHRWAGGATQMQWSPRLNLRLDMNTAVALYGSVGRYTQAQRPDELRVEEGQSEPDRAQLLTQAVLGVGSAAAATTQWRLEIYRKYWQRLSPYYDNVLDSQNLIPALSPGRVRVAPLSADADGIELSLRRPWRRELEVWGSIGLAGVSDQLRTSRIWRSWDQRWNAAAGFGWTGEHLLLVGTMRTHGGWPRTPFGPGTASASGPPTMQLSQRNSARWGTYLDTSLRAAWTLPLTSGSLELWTEVTNLTNRSNSCCLRLGRPGPDQELATSLVSWQQREVSAGIAWRLR